MPNISDLAPNLSLTTATGEAISLSDMWRNGHAVLLVFLRHLG